MASLIGGCLLAGCAGLGLQEKAEARGSKFPGTYDRLARCVLDELKADSRWVIRALQYEVRRYPDIGMTEIYAYAPGVLPGTYARNSPDNPDAVITQTPALEIHSRSPSAMARDVSEDYSFVLTLKRTDSATVYANLNGKKYEGGIAWRKLSACSR